MKHIELTSAGFDEKDIFCNECQIFETNQEIPFHCTIILDIERRVEKGHLSQWFVVRRNESSRSFWV